MFFAYAGPETARDGNGFRRQLFSTRSVGLNLAGPFKARKGGDMFLVASATCELTADSSSLTRRGNGPIGTRR